MPDTRPAEFISASIYKTTQVKILKQVQEDDCALDSGKRLLLGFRNSIALWIQEDDIARYASY
ncbi:hypothetical protein ASE74_22345 [Pedobacter sp. Leaf216]|nr:hypothetical protein ASE74_22345 [Pedobacter sp. Leaf216]